MAASWDPVSYALLAIVLLGLVLRVVLTIEWRPAFLGYPDGANYLLAAQGPLFGDPVRVAGYVLLLRLLHDIWPHLVLVTIVQHLIGVASGVLLYDAVRRVGLPRALGLLPAAVVILGGSQILLEHEVLTDAVFIFLIDLSLWLVVRTWQGSLLWSFATGLCLGAATIDRTVGLEVLPFALTCLCIAPAHELSKRRLIPTRLGPLGARFGRLADYPRRHPVGVWRSAALFAALAGTALVIMPFLAAHKAETGVFNFTSEGNLQLYGRVAPWADCTKFTPPAGTANLCIRQPVSLRPGSQVWEFDPPSPVLRVYGQTLKPGEDAKLGAFAIAAIKAEPLTYLRYVGRDLVRVVDPSFSESPNPAIGNGGAGYSPAANVNWYLLPSTTAGATKIVHAYYSGSVLHAGSTSFLRSWERATRLEGPAMAVVLVLALLSLFLAAGPSRRLSILMVVVSAALVVGPILVVDYDYRYVIPAFGPLTVAAAIGAYELARRATRRLRSPGSTARA